MYTHYGKCREVLSPNLGKTKTRGDTILGVYIGFPLCREALIWVAVKELSLNYYIEETLLFTCLPIMVT